MHPLKFLYNLIPFHCTTPKTSHQEEKVGKTSGPLFWRIGTIRVDLRGDKWFV